ncbi:hypothetical protein NA56DRAFT_326288 [Hyaloscypha hepaticicola]|uniref:Uncharacterized protein n=1 Tax=Hyaloscypha hepaticicola TaxID=2082293 RepID=A0A2J6PP41_9HELO|nr:hypothetical protein NA56DRAFT_326288 [Hyaloscypha hepaticicola]
MPRQHRRALLRTSLRISSISPLFRRNYSSKSSHTFQHIKGSRIKRILTNKNRLRVTKDGFIRLNYFSLLGDRQSEETHNFMAVSDPGPLFLLFLQDGLFHAESYGQACQRDLKTSTGSTGWKEVTEGTEYFSWFHDDFEWNYWVFLKHFNEVWLDVGNGRLQASTGAFDKELIWYYGVGGLEGTDNTK